MLPAGSVRDQNLSMGRSTDDDPLAVRTMLVAGEEVAFSDPFVSDAERAAAGRETVAERTRALLADGPEVLRVWCARDPVELRGRLGSGRHAIWAEGDVLHVLWRSDADQVWLSGGISAPMWPVPDADGLWEASLRVRRLDESVITLFVMSLATADLPFGQPPTDQLTWRGPLAPGEDDGYRPLAGRVEDHVWHSAALRADRTVTVYVPPADLTGRPLAGCVLADGEATRSFAQALEPALLSGAVPPVLLVGVHNAVAAGDAARRSDPRAREYLPRRAPRRVAGPSRTVRHYLAAGTLEEGFRRSTRDWAERLRRAGVPCTHHEWAGGHDPFWWQRSLPDALAWLLP